MELESSPVALRGKEDKYYILIPTGKGALILTKLLSAIYLPPHGGRV